MKRNIGGCQVYPVDSFVESSTYELAKKYLDSGEYLWNRGMFIFKVSTLMYHMKCHMPDTYQSLHRIEDALGTDQQNRVPEREYEAHEAAVH